MKVITSTDFKPFDWNAVTESYRRRLPHLTMPGAIYFVTFRLADSLPGEVAERWRAERAKWLLANPQPWSEETELAYHRQFTMRMERWLDSGHGTCLLKEKTLRAEVLTSLNHGTGSDYQLGDWVIMPNHVHLLIMPLREVAVSKLVGPAKGASSRRINKLTGGRGAIWMDENFDHIIRGMASLKKFQQYIADNPSKAGLPPGAFDHEQRWELR